MNEIFSQISRMQRQQQQVAGPHFAELSTEETWRELLRWIVEDRTGDFATQMVEVAALAAWALESTAEDQPPSSSEDREENEETAWNDEPPLAPVHPRFLWKQPDRF